MTIKERLFRLIPGHEILEESPPVWLFLVFAGILILYNGIGYFGWVAASRNVLCLQIHGIGAVIGAIIAVVFTVTHNWYQGEKGFDLPEVPIIILSAFGGAGLAYIIWIMVASKIYVPALYVCVN